MVAHTMTINCAALAAGQLLHRVLRRRADGARAQGVDRERHRRPRRQEGLRGRRQHVDREHRQRAEPSRSRCRSPDWTDCLVMLQQGQVDAISTDDTILAGLAAQDPTVKLVGAAVHRRAVRDGDRAEATTDFTRFVNGVLAKIRANGALGGDLPALAGPAPARPPARPVPGLSPCWHSADADRILAALRRGPGPDRRRDVHQWTPIRLRAGCAPVRSPARPTGSGATLAGEVDQLWAGFGALRDAARAGHRPAARAGRSGRGRAGRPADRADGRARRGRPAGRPGSTTPTASRATLTDFAAQTESALRRRSAKLAALEKARPR